MASSRFSLGHVPWNRGLTKETDSIMMKISLQAKGRKPSKTAVENSVKARKGKCLSEKHKQAISAGYKEYNKDGCVNKKLSIAVKKLWQNDNYAKLMRFKLSSAIGKHPNKGESEFLAFLTNNFGFEWKYTGSGLLIRKGKCPDFWNGENKVVEFYGKHWHENDNPQDRIDFWRENGLHCEVIWDYEYQNNKPLVIRKLSALIENNSRLNEAGEES